SIHVQTRAGDAYNNDRLALCWDLVTAVNAELKALAAAGADWIQVDEPSAAIVPGQAPEYVKMFNACVEGVKAKIGYHVCFGNLLSRPRGKRSYRWMFPALLETRCDQFVFEYANREMAEIDMWKDVGVDRDIACGVVDVKSFYMETREDNIRAATRRELLKLAGGAAAAGAVGFPAVARAQARPGVPSAPLRVGILAIRAGIAARVGTAGLRGTEWWTERVNKAGGILGRQVQLVVEEESTPKDTVERYRKLILQDKVEVVIGGISTGVTLALGPVAE